MLTLQLAGNTTRINAASHMVVILLRRQLLQKPLDSRLSNEEMQEILLTIVNIKTILIIIFILQK